MNNKRNDTSPAEKIVDDEDVVTVRVVIFVVAGLLKIL
jgi:hypothetical protein